MELEDQQLTDGIIDIITILSDGKELKDKECSKQAVYKLSKLQQENFVITTETETEVCWAALASITEITKELKSKQEEAKGEIILKTQEAKIDAMLKQEETVKDVALKHEEAAEHIFLRKEEDNKTVHDSAESCSNLFKREESELRDKDKTVELEKTFSNNTLELESLNMLVNEVEQDVENLKTVSKKIQWNICIKSLIF